MNKNGRITTLEGEHFDLGDIQRRYYKFFDDDWNMYQ